MTRKPLARKKKALIRPRRIPLKSFPFTPSTYPGRRPRFSFLFTPKGIYRFKPRDLDRVLATRGLAPTSERYAILAYGSNACPGQLLRKKLTDVPVIFGRLDGAMPVYACRRTDNGRGYVPATLARANGRRFSWVTLLTADQLERMDKTEGRPWGAYVLAELPDVHFSVGKFRVSPLYSYVDVRGGVMIVNDAPVNLRSARQKRAKSLYATIASTGDPKKWLDFDIIPDLDPPAEFSRIGRSTEALP